MSWKNKFVIGILLGAMSLWFASTMGEKGLAQPRASEQRTTEKSMTEKSRMKEKAGLSKTEQSIAETKKKGFDGVDFSYDVFGAPPGQDPQKIAEEVMAKDIEEKPKVMAKQKQLLRDRYNLDCKTQSGVTMTKGKSQPIGPT